MAARGPGGRLGVPVRAHQLGGLVGISPDKNNAVAGLINFMRNIGSSVGTSFVTTMLARRSQYHQEILINYTTPGNPNFQNSVSGRSEEHTSELQSQSNLVCRL